MVTYLFPLYWHWMQLTNSKIQETAEEIRGLENVNSASVDDAEIMISDRPSR